MPSPFNPWNPARIFCIFLAGTAAQAQADPAEAKAVEIRGPAGLYTLAQWKLDWPGCKFEGGIRDGRVTVTDEGASKRWLRVNYAPGQIGPEKGGAGWRLPTGTREFAELTYTMRFSAGFDWVKGGKLPGLCGGPENVSGGRPATGRNGFSARLMWRRDGRAEAYVYHKHQPTDYGDPFAFPADFRLPTQTPVHVRMQVAMNSPGERDGTLRVWLAVDQGTPRLMVERTDLEWRDDRSFGVDSLYFETFHGGGDLSWAPQRPCWAEFTNLRMGTPPKN